MFKQVITASALCVAAFSAPDEREIDQIGAWTRACHPRPDACALTQEVVALGLNAPWANVFVARDGEDVVWLIDTSPPAAGQIIFMLEKRRPMLLSTEECTNARCRFRVRLSLAQLGRIAAGGSIDVILPGENRREGRLNIDLDGLRDAVDTLPVTL